MSTEKTLMANYSTLEYRDKIEKEQKAAIARLLDVLPSYITDYNVYKKSNGKYQYLGTVSPGQTVAATGNQTYLFLLLRKHAL